jgi:poly(ribitol-phosphate) beta-N-acetylglucosaminyltransferase
LISGATGSSGSASPTRIGEDGGVPIKVSVVVPVYNPGAYIEPCIRSLLGQSMPDTELELIFVNDGSTDDSLERLERRAAQHPQIRVISIENSGWPGRPRNVGTDAARGTYVMYVDQDDTLEPEALERMYALGHANAADVVLGKVISDFRAVDHKVYRAQRARCSVFDSRVMYSLTPHKMLRTQFLRDGGIRYPEGRRRLEDQVFMTTAYFAAKNISIVSDYVCYRYLRRPDGRNAGSERADPPGYYANLEEVLDVVDAYTQPGEQRDRFYRRFLRNELLGRLTRRNLLQLPQSYSVSLLSTIRLLLQTRFPVSVDAGLPAALRIRAACARWGTVDQIAAQADLLDALKASGELVAARIDRSTIHLDVEVRLTHDARPLLLEKGPAGEWLLPSSLAALDTPTTDRQIDDVSTLEADVVIGHRESRDEWFLPGSITARIEPQPDADRAELVWSGSAHLDPTTAAGGRPLRAGVHNLTVRADVFGLTRNARLHDKDSVAEAIPVIVGTDGRTTRIHLTGTGSVSVNADAGSKTLVSVLRQGILAVEGFDRLVVSLPLNSLEPPTTAILTLRHPGGRRRSARWYLRPEQDGSQLRLTAVGGRRALALGRSPLEALLRLEWSASTQPLKVTLATTVQLTRRQRVQMAVAVAGRAVRKGIRIIRSRIRLRAKPPAGAGNAG